MFTSIQSYIKVNFYFPKIYLLFQQHYRIARRCSLTCHLVLKGQTTSQYLPVSVIFVVSLIIYHDSETKCCSELLKVSRSLITKSKFTDTFYHLNVFISISKCLVLISLSDNECYIGSAMFVGRNAAVTQTTFCTVS